MMIGAATPTNAVANALGSLFVLISLLFAGYFLNNDEMPRWCRVFSMVSYLNYGYSGLVVNEFLNAPGEFEFTALIDSQEFVPLRIRGMTLVCHTALPRPVAFSGEMVLCEFGFEDKLFAFYVFMLCMIGGICCLITYAILLVSGWDLSPSLDLTKIRSKDAAQRETGANSEVCLQSALEKDVGTNGLSMLHSRPPSFFKQSLSSGAESRFYSPDIRQEDQNNRFDGGWDPRYTYQSLVDDDGTPVGIIARISAVMWIDPCVMCPDQSDINRLTLSWQNITCIVSSTLLYNERIILRNISGIAGPLPIAPTTVSSSARSCCVVDRLMCLLGVAFSGCIDAIDSVCHHGSFRSRKDHIDRYLGWSKERCGCIGRHTHQWPSNNGQCDTKDLWYVSLSCLASISTTL